MTLNSNESPKRLTLQEPVLRPVDAGGVDLGERSRLLAIHIIEVGPCAAEAGFRTVVA